MVNATLIPKPSDLLALIRTEVGAKRLKPIDLAREAGLQPSTLYSMLEPNWSNRAIDNIEALAAAFERLTSQTQAGTATADPATA